MSVESAGSNGTLELGSIDQPAPPASRDGGDPYLGMVVQNRYLIEKELGRGGVGVVYLGRDRQLISKPVVIKVLLEEAGKNEWFKKKFRMEMEALARIDHPGVVGVLDSGQMPDGKPFLVMQYIEGTNLRSAMTAEGMSLDRVAHLIRQMGQALSIAHDKGVIHRDLKPENIMLQNLGEDEEQVKLIDFGISTVKDPKLDSKTEMTVIVGTLSYMAPEQLMGMPSSSSDIYALGVIAYEMLCGHLPFNPINPLHLREMQKEGVKIKPKDLCSAIPEAAEEVILKALSFDPKDRQARARDFGEQLARALTMFEVYPFPQTDEIKTEEVKPVPALPPNNGREAAWSRINGRVVIAALVVISVISAALFALTRMGDRDVIPTLQVTSAGGGDDKPPPPIKPERELIYSFLLQRNPRTNPGSKPILLLGETMVAVGDRFRLNIFSPQAGWLYVLNERPEMQDGVPKFNTLFPLPRDNQAAAAVLPNHPIQVLNNGWFEMDDETGAEKFWLIWAASEVPELEALKEWDNAEANGEIRSVEQIKTVQAFIKKNSDPGPQIEKDKDHKHTKLKGGGDVLVHLITVAHRQGDL